MGHAEFTLKDSVASQRISLDEYWMPFTPNRDFKADPKMIVRGEGVWFWNVNQGDDENGDPAFGRQRLITALAALEYDDRWLLSGATTLRTDTVRAPGLSQSPTDWLITASLEYMPVRGMRLGVGYRAVREVPLSGDDTRQYTSHTVGVRFRYVVGVPTITLARR